MTIAEMHRGYYGLPAGSYDELELTVERRLRFAQAACAFVAEGLITMASCKRLLSVGCGTGRKERDIVQALGRPLDVFGIDPSPAMAALSRAAGLVVYEGTLNTFHASAPFDASMFFYALPTLPTEALRLLALRQIRALLRFGRRILVDVEPFDDRHGWGPEVAALFTRQHLEDAGCDPGDFFYQRIGTEDLAFWHFFTEEEIASLLEQAGFAVSHRRYIGFFKSPGESVERGEGTLIAEAVAV